MASSDRRDFPTLTPIFDEETQTTTVYKYYFYCPGLWSSDEAFYKYRAYLDTIPECEDKDDAIEEFEEILNERASLVRSGTTSWHKRDGSIHPISNLIDELSFKRTVNNPEIDQSSGISWHRGTGNDNC